MYGSRGTQCTHQGASQHRRHAVGEAPGELPGVSVQANPLPFRPLKGWPPGAEEATTGAAPRGPLLFRPAS